MKGFIDENGIDRPACVNCKHKRKMTIETPCYNCIDTMDLVLKRPNHETEFAAFETESAVDNLQDVMS